MVTKKTETMSANLREIITNESTMRRAFLQKLLDGPGRDLNKECGYPDKITTDDFHAMYEREGIGARVNDIWVDESWKNKPLIYETETPDQETEFEKRWAEIEEQHRILHFLERADRLSGVGRFGILLLGLADGRQLNEEVIPKNGMELIYLRPFEENVVAVHSTEGDSSNPRFCHPTMYEVTLDLGSSKKTMIHHSRVIHLADFRQMSEIYGTPRMQKTFNRLLDIRKILSGSGEMFWKGAFPGYSFEVAGEGDVELDKKSLRAEMENYMNGLQRYLALEGVSAKSLSPQVEDPKGHLESQLSAIAISIGIPKRILFGSEQAQLASVQDSRTWAGRLSHRQNEYVTPMVIRPLIDRLISLEVLPEPMNGYEIHWPDTMTQSEDEKAAVAAKWAEAFSKYVAGGVEQLIAPEDFLSLFGGLSVDEIKQITKGLGDLALEVDGIDDHDHEDIDDRDGIGAEE